MARLRSSIAQEDSMDPRRFDSLSRDLSRARSRRGALASLVGGTLALLGPTETTAKHKHKHKKKRSSPASPPGSSPPPGCTPRCTPDQICQNGECVCPSGTRYCSDYDLCGECCSSADCCGTSPCPPGGQTCLAGLVCGVSCSDGVM